MTSKQATAIIHALTESAGRTSKSFIVWEQTKQWCQENPGKTAAIMNMAGSFRVSWEPYQPKLRGVDFTYYYQEPIEPKEGPAA